MNELLPTPLEIAECPELAIFAVVEFVTDTCVRALVAAHPELDGPDPPGPLGPPAHAALRVVSQTWRLKLALERYRALTTAPSPSNSASEDHEIPF